MKKTFTFSFAGQGNVEMEAYWNEKSYAGTKYIEVKATSQQYGAGTKLVWNDERGWTKHGGMPYAQAVADLFGLK